MKDTYSFLVCPACGGTPFNPGFSPSLSPLHCGGKGPSSWLVSLEGETMLTSPSFSLGRGVSASDSLRCSEPRGNVEVKALPPRRRSAVVQSCLWLTRRVSQILGYNASSLAARYAKLSNISSNINHTDESFISHRPHFGGSYSQFVQNIGFSTKPCFDDLKPEPLTM